MKSLIDLSLDEIRMSLEAHEADGIPSRNATRRAAVAMILRPSSEGLETLFLKRAEHPLDPWSGHMAFPGGHQDESDESLEHTARRETHEETGLILEPEKRIGRLHDISGGRLRSTGMSVSPFVFEHHGPHDLQLSDEIAEAVWVPLAFLANPKNVTPYYYPPDPMKRPFPSFQFEKYTIWGMTYRMVGNFLQIFDVEIPGEGAMTEVE